MPTFRHRPSHRRDPRPVARDLVIGHDNAKAVNRGTSTLHIRPVQPRDHFKRYQPDQTLNVRAFVGGPTWCKIAIIEADRVPLTAALNLANAKRAGHRTTTDLRAAFEHSYGEGGRPDRLVWVLVVRLDKSETPRLLAARSDELYVSTPATALADEPEALSEEDWKRHVGKPSELRAIVRTAEQILERAATSNTVRIVDARMRARVNGYDMRDEFRRYDHLVQQGRAQDALRQLEAIESRVFPKAA